MSTLAAYVGRKVDLLAFQAKFPFLPGRDTLLAQQLVGAADGGSIVAGVEKLAQRVLILLLTPVGSLQYLPLQGTRFMIDAMSGRWRTVADVSLSFYAARLALARQLQAVELATDPDDERYGSLNLNGVTLSGTTVAISLYLQSLAGTTYSFITPIQVPPP